MRVESNSIAFKQIVLLSIEYCGIYFPFLFKNSYMIIFNLIIIEYNIKD